MDNKNSMLAGLAVFGGLLCVALCGIDGMTYNVIAVACAALSAVAAGTLFYSVGELHKVQTEKHNRLFETQAEKVQSYIDCVNTHQQYIETGMLTMQQGFEQMQNTLNDWLPVNGKVQNAAEKVAQEIEAIQDVLHELAMEETDVRNSVAKCTSEMTAVREKVDSVIAAANTVFTQSKAAFLEAIKEWENSNRQLTTEAQKMTREEMRNLDEMLNDLHDKLDQFMEDLRETQEDADSSREELYTKTVRNWSHQTVDLLSRHEKLVAAQQQSIDKLSASYENFQTLTNKMLNVMSDSTDKDNELVRELMKWSKKNGK